MKFARSILVQSLILFAFWYALSGRNEPLFLITGALTAIAVALVTSRITATCLGEATWPARKVPAAVLSAIGFVIWMAGRILLASVQLAVIALSPRMPLDPCSVRFRTELRHPMARSTLANSISLVPGTLTVDIQGDEILVHALSPRQIDDLVSGRLQNKIAHIFLEPPQPKVDPASISMEDF